MPNWIKAERGDIIFEDSSVGRLKKKIWDASDDEIDQMMAAAKRLPMPLEKKLRERVDTLKRPRNARP